MYQMTSNDEGLAEAQMAPEVGIGVAVGIGEQKAISTAAGA